MYNKIHDEQNINAVHQDRSATTPQQATLQPEAKGRLSNTDLVFTYTFSVLLIMDFFAVTVIF